MAEILLFEQFEDNHFASRGWYDFDVNRPRKVTPDEHIPGSTASFECTFLQGQRGCEHGSPARIEYAETEKVYFSYWVKYSSNYTGSNRSYHPHEFHLATTEDTRYFSPSNSVLNTYIEQIGGRPVLSLQDSKNVDPNCILFSNGSFQGCNGDPNTYNFTEQRSVAACNGIVGELDGRTCYYAGGGQWYSARTWRSDGQYFRDTPGPYYKNDWHHIEVMMKLNSIQNGKGVADGQIRYWYDGQLLISSDNILFRTAQYPNMKWSKLLIAPYIGDGSPITQTFWVDDLIVSTHRIGGADSAPAAPSDLRIK